MNKFKIMNIYFFTNSLTIILLNILTFFFEIVKQHEITEIHNTAREVTRIMTLGHLCIDIRV